MAQDNNTPPASQQPPQQPKEEKATVEKVRVKVAPKVAAHGGQFFDPEQSDPRKRNIGAEPVTVEETANVQNWLLTKQLVRA